MKKKKKRVCRDCGKKRRSTGLRICPLIQNVHGKDVLVMICESCENERAANI